MSAAGAGRLIVCPTPIGNLEDITLRTLAALREADVIACEDTRTSKVLLDRYGVSAERVRYDAHAERRAAPRLVDRMLGGVTVALVSDAGMPLVSDPGLILVQAAVAAGLAVEVLPGPSAALTALVVVLFAPQLSRSAEAAGVVAGLTGVPANDLYAAIVAGDS